MNESNFAAIPAELKAINRWVVWRREVVKGKTKKAPYRPTGPRAAITNPNHFSDFKTCANAQDFNGVGFVFSNEDNFLGIDLDNVIENGEVVRLESLVKQLQQSTYCEISPSGNGIKAIIRASKPGKNCKASFGDGSAIEIYDDKRYFTMTGNSTGLSTIAENQELVNRLYSQHMGKKKKSKPKDTAAIVFDLTGPSGQSDYETLNGFLSKNEKGRDLFYSTNEAKMAYANDDSSMDLALMSLLAHHTKDKNTAYRLFNASGLAQREKWKERADYRERTLETAFNSIDQPNNRISSANSCHEYQGFALTDLGNAELFIARKCGLVKCVNRAERIYLYDGQRWKDADNIIIGEIGEVFKTVTKEVESRLELISDSSEKKRLLVVGNHYRSSQSAARLDACKRVLKGLEQIKIEYEDFDKDSHFLNCCNGAVNLKTGELLNHCPSHLISKITHVAYNPNATCPIWLEVLGKIFRSRPHLIPYIQKVFGYALTGEVTENCLFFFIGGGCNGKSLLLDILRQVAGEYYGAIPDSVVMESCSSSHPTNWATLRGVRVGTLAESGAGKILNDAAIKKLTSGDTITARRMHQDFWDLRPKVKAFIATNQMPNTKDDSHGLKRRLHLIEFDQQFWLESLGETGPEEFKADPKLKEKLENEIEGILAWIVRGAIAYYKEGLQLPMECIEAVEQYISQADAFQQFLSAVLEPSSTGEIKASEAYRAFGIWEKTSNHPNAKQMTPKKFGERMGALPGSEKIRRGEGYYYTGYAFKREFR